MNPKTLFEILVREHGEMLNVFLRCSVQSPQLADELFQETIVVAWRNMEKFDTERSFGRWLRGIARKLILAEYRKRSQGVLLLDERALDRVDDRCDQLHRRPGDTLQEKLAGLRECIAILPDKFRRAVELRYMEDVRGARLAARLETTAENAKKLLQRGRQRLLNCLQNKLSLETR
jgi:RNA polymerase sigma-70 factor (ECF subfamily)